MEKRFRSPKYTIESLKSDGISEIPFNAEMFDPRGTYTMQFIENDGDLFLLIREGMLIDGGKPMYYMKLPGRLEALIKNFALQKVVDKQEKIKKALFEL